MEFDYVGVIIGEDLRYKKEPAKALKIADELIKNTYRTLMTRGMKGCYVYFCDKPLRHYVEQRLKANTSYMLMAAEKKVIYKA